MSQDVDMDPDLGMRSRSPMDTGGPDAVEASPGAGPSDGRGYHHHHMLGGADSRLPMASSMSRQQHDHDHNYDQYQSNHRHLAHHHRPTDHQEQELHHRQQQQQQHRQLFPPNYDTPEPPSVPPPDDIESLSQPNHAFAPVNPDDFYKSYRALHFDANPDDLPMASSAVARPSMRSNGDRTTPRHPAVPPTNRNPNQSGLRSVSNPSSATSPSGQPSVRDLTKRFDQAGSSTSIPRASARPKAATQARRDPGAASNLQNGGASYSALRSRGAQDSSSNTVNATVTRRPQRPIAVAEDQVSSNPQSFASRVGKPRNSVGSNPNASKSATHLAQRPQPTPPAIPQTQPLLFGEILPDQRDNHTAGYGIEGARPRRTSESNVRDPSPHQRSRSSPDEPSSPSIWYQPLGGEENGPNFRPDPPSSGRLRSTSDATAPKSPASITRKPPPSGPSAIPSSVSQSTSASKLPLSVRKLNSPTNSSSPPSTRSNSPSTSKRPPVNGRTPYAGAATRAKTPTSRAKTPTQTTSSRKPAPSSVVTPNSNSRLKAYINTPPPKLSPPLRSSRPRQPVSMSSTASSRMKAVDRAKSPSTTHGSAQRANAEATRRRKISVGPIDFEQRREHIRLAYSKSIRESQALEARQKAAERRQKEMEAAAKAKAAAEAVAVAGTMSAVAATAPFGLLQAAKRSGSSIEKEETPLQDATPELPLERPTTKDLSQAEDESLPPASRQPEGGEPADRSIPPLTIATSVDASQAPGPRLLTDSPTLGVPGSFPALSPPMEGEEFPQSAVTNTSVTTEFEAGAQTEPPIQHHSPVDVPITIVKSPSPEVDDVPFKELPSKAEYRYPFEDELDSPEPPSTSQDTTREFQPVSQDFDKDFAVPGAFGAEHGDERSSQTDRDVYQATLTIVPPLDSAVSADRVAQTPVPFPRMDSLYESDCQSETDNDQEAPPQEYGPGQGDTTDACTETEDEGRTEECLSDSRYDDHLSHRDSTCESSDAEPLDSRHYDSFDDPPGIQGLNTLLLPPSQPLGIRTSQQSTWTDLSVDSTGHPGGSAADTEPDRESPSYGHATIFGSSSQRQSTDPVMGDVYYEASGARPSLESSHHHLPEVDAGGEFSLSYDTEMPAVGTSSTAPLPEPNHRPPPIPTPSSALPFDLRSSSAFLDQAAYDSTVASSARGSEDYVPTLATPQSLDASSLATSDQRSLGARPSDVDDRSLSLDLDAPSEKERQRLAQRRNVIKELVDTEAVFVRDMNIVEEIYKGTAEACPRLDDKTVKLIFRNTDDIIQFHTSFLEQIKEAVATVYVPRHGRSQAADKGRSNNDTSDSNDRATSLGPTFKANIDKMKTVHEVFLRSSDLAAKRLIQMQQDAAVKLWLNECNEVAKDLTAAWDLDSLLIKPMQRLTKYPNLIITLLQHTPEDHPDRDALMEAKDALETAIIDINKTKKNFELVGQIVGRKRKESDVKAGIARAFGKRVDKLQASGSRIAEDADYSKLFEKFGDDYLRLQVVLRDVEFYTRQVSAYVHEFLQYLSSVELVMRLQPGPYPELESKWVQFNISIRELGKVALEEHLEQVRKQVIEPFEQVIKAYGNPSLAMKKRQKRRVDFERLEQLKRGGRSIDPKLRENVDQYEALNDTLKKELPKLSALTERVGNICVGNFVNIQAHWYSIWVQKMKTVVGDTANIPDAKEIVATFQRDFPYAQEQVASIKMLDPTNKGRASLSTMASADESMMKGRSRPSDVETRGRGLSANGDFTPSLPTPDFVKHQSGTLSLSPGLPSGVPSPHQYSYRDQYAGLYASPAGSGSPDVAGSSRSLMGIGAASTRPSTGRSVDSGGLPRQSSESAVQFRRDSNTTYNSNYPSQEHRRFSGGIFHSALPLPDGPEDSRRSSRASSRERAPLADGYNVLWLAASLFEFNITTTKHEAGYPYLIYQAGEIFDVIAEKGELWLAKNQDDTTEQVGWIWSKHFAKLADS